MAKQYVCKVCGYVHTGDKAPDVCPQCQQTNCFEEKKTKRFSTDSNVYTIVYATVIVIIVAVLLSLVHSVLKPMHDENERLDTQKQILVALNQDITQGNPSQLYADIVKEDSILINGEKKVYYIATLDNTQKLVVPLKGQGLWGAIWGYVALDEDKNTIFGINFGHEGETPGLGGEIVTENFRRRFFGKHIKDAEGNLRSVAVLKEGKKAPEGQDQVDAWAGATITSTGVNDMLYNSLNQYKAILGEE
ncbi:MAG: NADH:ubiquinone reductase (Na(+)-transporting) subunit C [Paludibacteraceae bacterium]|nr:NADH:ubiquinone reductase (Na(+)-transporting) subunit C [Paludibacteraceae bacterium]